MRDPEPEDVITSSSLASSLRTAFQSGSLGSRLLFQVHVGPASAWAAADADRIEVGTGVSGGDPDLVVRAGPELRLLLAGRLTAAEAFTSDSVEIEGAEENLQTFIDTFRVPLDVADDEEN